MIRPPSVIPTGARRGVFKPSEEYERQEATWRMMEDLISGTDAMREAGQLYLPKEPRETAQAYKNRLARSWLFPQFRNAVASVVSQPFAQPISIEGKERLSARMQAFIADPCRDGSSMLDLAESLFSDMVVYGRASAFVDYPTVAPGLNLAQETNLDLRPVVLRIHPRDAIRWRVAVDGLGGRKVREIAFIERSSREVTGSGTGSATASEDLTLRVVREDGSWERWAIELASSGSRKVGGQPRALVSGPAGSATFADGLPLEIAYARRVDVMEAEPPYKDLAEQNVQHWQGNSDHANLMRFARCATLCMTGFTDEEKAGTTVGVNQIMHSKNVGANARYVEHTGTAINASRDDLKRNEERMETLGAAPLVNQANLTATGAVLGAEKEASEAQAWVRRLEEMLVSICRRAAEWLGEELPEDFNVDVYSEFNLVRGDGSMDTIIKLRMNGDVTRETTLAEAKRRGVFSSSVDPKKEAEAAEAEAPMQDALAGDPLAQ